MDSPRSGMKPFLSLHRAAIRLNESLVFRNTDWTFAQGQHWALVGPNGSGKTLLASALYGAAHVAQGEVRYHFRTPPGRLPEDCIAHVSFEDQRAFVPDACAQSRWNAFETDEAVPVRELLSRERIEEINPFEVTARSPRAEAEFGRRRRRAVRQMQIGDLLDRPLMTLSNGETRKVLLARALIRQPALLILDDPFTGLDRRSRLHFREIIERLMKGRTRVLLIATRPEDLPRGITHVLVVRRCRVVAQGPIRAMRRAPAVRALFAGQTPRRRASEFLAGYASRQVDAGPVLVRLERVRVTYGKRTILRDLSWTVRSGESWALLGPNGSGKTTLLSLIIGDNPQAYANHVEVFGRRRGSGESIWDLKKKIGWVSPELHLHYDQAATCVEVVLSGFFDSVGLFRRPSPAQRRAAQQWLAHLGLAGHAGEPLGNLSAGLQRMVLLARALVKAPALLVLDEPCQGLDAEHRRLFVRAVDAIIRRTGTTVIYVTHRPDEIPTGIRRVLRLGATSQSRQRIMDR